MARRYRRSILAGFDQFGQEIVEKLEEETTSDISFLNFFQAKFTTDEFKYLLDKITELNQKKFDTEKYEVSSYKGKELFEFNIFFIGEEISEALEVWKKVERIIKENKFVTAESIFLIKSSETQIPAQIKELPKAFLITSELKTKATIKKEELKTGVFEFLSFILYGNIYEDRDFYHKAIIGGESKLLSFGIASLSLPILEIAELASLFAGIKLLHDITSAELHEDMEVGFSRAKDWVGILDDVESKEELGLPHPRFIFKPKIKLFSSYRNKEENFKKLLTETNNTLSKFSFSKNEIAKKTRKELEDKVKKTIEERRVEILELILNKESKITPLSKLRSRLDFLIGKKGLITTYRDELENIRENWEAYPKQDFPKKIHRHPYWLFVLLVILIGALPWPIKWGLISTISSLFCLKFSGCALFLVILYLLFSKLSINYTIQRLRVKYAKVINGIDRFYHQNLKSLVSTFRFVLLNKLHKNLKTDLKYLSIFIAYLNDRRHELIENLSKLQEISFGEKSDPIKISQKEIETLLKELGILDIKPDDIKIDFNPWIKNEYEEFYNEFTKKINFILKKKILEKRKELFAIINETKKLKDKLIRILHEERPLPFYHKQLPTSNIIIYYPKDLDIKEIEERFRNITKTKMDLPDKLGILNVSY